MIRVIFTLALVLVACGRAAEAPNIAEPDPLDQIVALEAQLYRDALTADPTRCPDACTLAKKICELSVRICTLDPGEPKCDDGAARCTKARTHVSERCTCIDDVR